MTLQLQLRLARPHSPFFHRKIKVCGITATVITNAITNNEFAIHFF